MGGSPDPDLSVATEGVRPVVRADLFRARRPLRRLAFYAPRARRRLFENYHQHHQHLQVPPPIHRIVAVPGGDEEAIPMDLPREIQVAADIPPDRPLPNPLVLLLDDVPPMPPGFAPFRVPREYPVIREENWEHF
ncbi:protein UL21A [Panine betaherpesvirus 2]|uniref:Protein UL21A n=1 Tax=Panine betaherpesvirus 2 TaxID=188763 RepID=Q8QS67_9BETA|nr:protein UL21A [Panine betaherpesvirus 2]AAM00671.1 protein UL21A [Panine betaherpesvirus 2]QXV67773.1 protein UL21A [Panine betaherpesvirus 2]